MALAPLAQLTVHAPAPDLACACLTSSAPWFAYQEFFHASSSINCLLLARLVDDKVVEHHLRLDRAFRLGRDCSHQAVISGLQRDVLSGRRLRRNLQWVLCRQGLNLEFRL